MDHAAVLLILGVHRLDILDLDAHHGLLAHLARKLGVIDATEVQAHAAARDARVARRSAVTKRLDTYEAMTAALLPFYEKEGLLRRVDGVGKPEEVTARVENALA